MEKSNQNKNKISPQEIAFNELMDSSFEMAKKLLPFLARRRIPLVPENYHLFYDYLLGTNPELIRRINETLQRETLFTTEVSRKLYGFFYDVDSENFRAMARVGERIGSISQSIEENLSQSLESTDRFKQALNDSASQIEQGDLEVTDFRDIVDGLLTETKSALNSQTALAELIEASNKVIATLTAELQDKTRQANVDELTQLYNRRYMSQRFKELTEGDVGRFMPIHLAIFDLDRFKVINDTWGHAIGDKVLIITSKIIQNFAGDRHLACRYGGEEFLIIYSGVDGDEAARLTEGVRRKVEETQITIRGQVVPVTLSAGLSSFVVGEDEQSLIGRADKALYQAKAAGRNLVRIWRADD
ncbi:MAG: GGDEF domain-containing protein [Deltaproteobacteria bacterium]|nr:GGDEF domain-containing protein [Deltaproteobacteria bacterium]